MTPKLITYKAADQDGHDGGFIAANNGTRAWGATEAEALQRLMERIFESEFERKEKA